VTKQTTVWFQLHALYKYHTMSMQRFSKLVAATLSANSLGQTVHIHRASVHQAAKMVTEGLAESNGSLPPGL